MALITLYRPDGEKDEYSDIPTWSVRDGFLTFVSHQGTAEAKQITTTLPYVIQQEVKHPKVSNL